MKIALILITALVACVSEARDYACPHYEKNQALGKVFSSSSSNEVEASTNAIQQCAEFVSNLPESERSYRTKIQIGSNKFYGEKGSSWLFGGGTPREIYQTVDVRIDCELSCQKLGSINLCDAKLKERILRKIGKSYYFGGCG